MHHLALHPTRLRAALVASTLSLAFVLTAVTAGSASAAPATPPSITITSTATAEVGQPVALTSAVLDAVDVYSYAITYTFDPAIFQYTADSASAGPTGGFDSVVLGTGTVTLLHTRLGTSPTLAGNLPATLSLTTIGSGTGAITASVELVGPNGVAQAGVANATSAPVVVTAVPVPQPSAPASTAPVPSTSPSVSPSATAVPAATGSLARTGADGGVLLALAFAGLSAIALGVLAYRRRFAGSR